MKKKQPATKADKMYQSNSEFQLSCSSKRKGKVGFFKTALILFQLNVDDCVWFIKPIDPIIV